MKQENERRNFLRKCWQMTFVAPLAGLWLAGCGSSKKSVATDKKLKATPCEDLTGVPAVDVEKRKSLGYTNLSPIPDKECRNCQLFIPPKEGSECGGCLLFAGPVSPEGYCTYWAPQV
ncbi:high-potential iron-sulfur protein [Persicitalea jodogahamensis]|uniref:high-potential iron-sulfur protein n=1 Tax=Persicitalea jodogahamensis TaxID=402147 RepID=UPI00167874AA|nr:high-potential iron-sulfur protein [Persicitalea jodogahamensis]